MSPAPRNARGRLVRQVLTENMLISIAGGSAALVVLRFARTSLVALMPADMPRLAEVRADWRMVALALLRVENPRPDSHAIAEWMAETR